jgi:hypothetical protein
LSRWPRLSRISYWLRTHTYNRYHLIDIRDAEPENPNGYRWGWLDRNHVLLLTAFTVLRQFVEREKPYDGGQPREGAEQWEIDAITRQKASHDEIMALYRWWTVERFAEYGAWEKARDVAYDAYCSNRNNEALCTAWIALENSEHARDDEMLHRLVAIRHAMWT